MSANIGLLFTKLYFDRRDLDQQKFENNIIKFNNLGNKLADIKNSSLPEEGVISLHKENDGEQQKLRCIELTTTYPGLLIGSGYAHNVKDDDALKLGFHFDYTTGLPVIPGSSVKGTLRSAFEKAAVYYDKEGKKIEKCLDNKGNEVKCTPSNKKVKKYASQYVKELLKEITGEDWTDDQIYDLEQSIFEGKEDQSLKDRDIFLDAFPVSVSRDGLLGNDYITPHKEPLKNPNPIQFLKVMPGVTFRFDFMLQDYRDKNGKKLSAGKKLELFKRILLDLGIGAKTNVGYGQFVENDEIECNHEENTMEDNTQKKSKSRSEIKLTEADNNLIAGREFEAEVIDITKKDYKFKLLVDFEVRENEDLTFTKKKKKLNISLQKGDKVKVVIAKDYIKNGKKVEVSRDMEKINP